jgi:ABC-type bacteriocin/lantibiotic exporter with double-glycine peptidase domain
MEIIIIFLIVVLVAAGYTIVNLFNKLEKYEEFIEEQEINNQTLLETLRKIDNAQMFEKDDEVGSLFNQISNTIIQFKDFNENA